MPTEIFKASRWTRGNLLFPTCIEVNDKAVSRRKRSWFHSDEMSMSISKVASVHIQTGLVWSEIRIESSGGSDPLTSNGHSKADALASRNSSKTLKPYWRANPKPTSEEGRAGMPALP